MPQWRRIPRPWLWVGAGAAALGVLLFVLWTGPWLFTQHPQRGLTAEQELKAKNDVRTTLVQTVAGLAVAGGAIVTYRTFRHTRIESDRAHELNQSQQVTEAYANAVEQLGHASAPVRLGALHSLVSLGQDHPSRRQTVVDVLCAYLRMPFVAPVTEDRWPEQYTAPVLPVAEQATPADEEADRAPVPQRDRHAEELVVRQTAQRLLLTHLRRPHGINSGADAQHVPASREETFWPGMAVDLTGATLVGFTFIDVSVVSAAFMKATFSANARFDGASCSEWASFHACSFDGVTSFARASFCGDALFTGTQFSAITSFQDTTFGGLANFDSATFGRYTSFLRATFRGAVRFSNASGPGQNLLDGARVRGLGDAALQDDRLWPEGWTVRPDPDDPAGGVLVREQEKKRRPRRTVEDA